MKIFVKWTKYYIISLCIYLWMRQFVQHITCIETMTYTLHFFYAFEYVASYSKVWLEFVQFVINIFYYTYRNKINTKTIIYILTKERNYSANFSELKYMCYLSMLLLFLS